MSDLGVSKFSSVTEATAIQGKSPNDMGMDEFFKLLVAQMTNQDMMNPESNTEFIAQMAQFSALQGVKDIQDNQTAAYAVSYAGKEVTVAHINESTGKLETVKGIVEKVSFYDGAPHVTVNGKNYPLHEIMEVNTSVAAQNEQSAGNSLSLVSGYIGKQVTVTDTTDELNPTSVTGIVTSVTLIGGKPYVIVDGKEYPYTAITSVGEEEDYSWDNEDGGKTDTDNSTSGTNTDKDTETDTDNDTDNDTGTGGAEYDTDDE